MPITVLVRRRIQLFPSALRTISSPRLYSDGKAKDHSNGAQPNNKKVKSKSASPKGQGSSEQPKQPSLFEQLFPDQQPVAEERREPQREPPRIRQKPFRLVEPRAIIERARRDENAGQSVRWSPQYQEMKAKAEANEEEISVLVLRNASKNLVEDDFRRLVPRGRHMEGWAMEQGDILQVIPGRDLRTLEQQNYYYLLFSSALSAHTYQSHATRVQRLVAQHTPSNIHSPILPPPGYMLKGLDANQAIESFTLAPPNQTLDLRQLKPPLTPVMDMVVRHRGYPALVKREERMPYEARLTMEGLQLHKSFVGHILMLSGRDRGLSWSGSDEPIPKITEWNPAKQFIAPSPMSDKPDATKKAHRMERGIFSKLEIESESGSIELQPDDRSEDEMKRRNHRKIYIVGFQTENAMQNFVRFWHKRPMDWSGFTTQLGREDEADFPPVTNVEVLW